jgi:predicted dehydrogenase
LITTGDRWHALASTWAMRAGKDVYSEKPSCMTIAGGRVVSDTAKRYGRIYQTGTQRLSESFFTFANEILRLGRLGEVHTVRAHIAPWDAAEMSYDWLPGQPEPSKDVTDWDAWLGPCPWRPYNEKYCSGGWRGYYDFHTSCIGEWGAHTFAQCQVAIGAADTAPIEYGYVNNESGDGMVVRFANGINMVLNRDMDNKYFHGSCSVRYEGTEGWITIGDGYEKPDVSSPNLMADYDKIVAEYVERTKHPQDHWRDFLDSIKSRRPAVSHAEVMHRSMTSVHAANICMWMKRDMKFDPIKEEFINDDEANRLRSRAMREPWIF